jgi:Tfp pilus assembly protein PilX
MNTHKNKKDSFKCQESGAALVTVLLITFLLGTACIAMLSAAGASARNSTDVLSETKAFYASESGIQASVNALRYGGDDGGPVNYKDAVNNFANSGDLSSWITYADCNGSSRVTISGDCANAYSITVRDPDNSMSSLSFRTSGAQFRVVNSDGTFGGWGASRQFTSGLGVTTISWVPNNPNPTALSFDADTPTAATAIGGFKVANAGTGGAAFDTATEFKVFYELVLPGNPGWLISGKIETTGAISVLSFEYVVTGSRIVLCGGTACGNLQIPPVANGLAEATTNVNAVIEPKEPHRLLVTATGFGPNKGNKVLEAVLQKTPLDGMNSSSPFSMNGPCSEPGNPGNTAVFQAGTSNVTTYSGVSSGGVVAPAFGFNSPCNLDTANAWIAEHLTPTGQNQEPQVNPPPAYFETSQLPQWQRTPQQMDEKVQIYRAQAQYSGTYGNPFSTKVTNPGYVEGQTGPITTVTFCEGDCTVDGDLGGGILVVTGKLNSLGGFGFKGLILVTGPGGWERKGGGCGTIIGNVVISPYTAADLISNVFTLPPKYEITGAGCSGVTYASLDDLFEGENSALTNFIRGVAEK